MKLHHKIARLFGYDLIRKKSSHHTLDLHLQKIITSNKITTVMDVGANKGQFAKRLRELGFRGKIISFEPILSEFHHIELLSKADPLWDVYNFAMGNSADILELNVTDSTDLSSFLQPNEFSKLYFKEKVMLSNTQKIEIKMLHHFIAEHNLVHESLLLKTDTQGFDLEVLKGAGDYLSALVKVIVIELSFKPIYNGMPSALEVIAFLNESGFNPSGLFQLSRDKTTLELIEMDSVFLNKKLFSAA
jgi:FkbM family methyltransferase